MSHIRTTFAEVALPASVSGLPRPMVLAPGSGWNGALSRWLGRIRARDEMRALTERERQDAGLTAYDIAIESGKYPWRD